MVIYDDFDLYQGAVRIRENGSAGTHNGMRNIVSLCGSAFGRVRIGFKPTEKVEIPLINLVLSGIRGEDSKIFDEATTTAAKASVDFVKGETLQNVMQKYNCKP